MKALKRIGTATALAAIALAATLATREALAQILPPPGTVGDCSTTEDIDDVVFEPAPATRPSIEVDASADLDLCCVHPDADENTNTPCQWCAHMTIGYKETINHIEVLLSQDYSHYSWDCDPDTDCRTKFLSDTWIPDGGGEIPSGMYDLDIVVVNEGCPDEDALPLEYTNAVTDGATFIY